MQNSFPLLDIYLHSLMHQELFLFKFSSNTWCNIFTSIPYPCLLTARVSFSVQVNRIEQVSSDDHQMSIGGGVGEGVGAMSGLVMGYVSNAFWVMVTWWSPDQNDRQTPVKTLPSRNFVCCGNNIRTTQNVCNIAGKDSLRLQLIN